ncbi:MAG: hypothetical protein ACD_65C00376G0018 [uncultured bacterium]|nr:MAG: hypothetical protein ACD_65C00376G0018 [uncultured bacterium]
MVKIFLMKKLKNWLNFKRSGLSTLFSERRFK